MHAQVIADFEKEVDDDPEHACCSCERLHQRKSVTRVRLSDNLGSSIWPALKAFILKRNLDAGDQVLYMCKHCKPLVKRDNLPARCVLNVLETVPMPPKLAKLDCLSRQLIQRAKCYQTRTACNYNHTKNTAHTRQLAKPQPSANTTKTTPNTPRQQPPPPPLPPREHEAGCLLAVLAPDLNKTQLRITTTTNTTDPNTLYTNKHALNHRPHRSHQIQTRPKNLGPALSGILRYLPPCCNCHKKKHFAPTHKQFSQKETFCTYIHTSNSPDTGYHYKWVLKTRPLSRNMTRNKGGARPTPTQALYYFNGFTCTRAFCCRPWNVSQRPPFSHYTTPHPSFPLQNNSGACRSTAAALPRNHWHNTPDHPRQHAEGTHHPGPPIEPPTETDPPLNEGGGNQQTADGNDANPPPPPPPPPQPSTCPLRTFHHLYKCMLHLHPTSFSNTEQTLLIHQSPGANNH